MREYQLIRGSFCGMTATLYTGTYRDCQGFLTRLKRRKDAHPNRDAHWLKRGSVLEVTDEGLGLIGDDCGTYSIEQAKQA